MSNSENPGSTPTTGDGGTYTDIFAEQSYEVPHPPPKKTFKPWHRPRKQYVRERLWANEIRALLKSRNSEEGKSIAYLGMPGSDFLDIRYFHQEFCAAGDGKLRFLGFDTSAMLTSPDRDAHNVSFQEVRALPGVDRASEVLSDDVRRLGEKNSIALKKAESLGPFDVINLDFCDHLGRDKPTLSTSVYNSLFRLFQLQHRLNRPWSILLTTRVGSDHIAAEVLQRLAGRLDELAKECQGFLTKFVECTSIESMSLDGLRSADGDNFVKCYGIGMVSWLLALAGQISCKLTVKSCAVYRVHKQSPGPDLLSTVLRFTPYSAITSDPTRLATIRDEEPAECQQALRLMQAMSTLDDVDERLKDDDGLLEDMVVATMGLLREARYDVSAYRPWCDDQD